MCCCCYRKGTNFQANHNCLPAWIIMEIVVVATAKVQIFKQITTLVPALSHARPLLLLPQRYKFSSKSQPVLEAASSDECCCCYRKGTNFQANHNCLRRITQSQKVVVATAKVQIFKQITTGITIYRWLRGCCCYRKGTNFQANHNRWPVFVEVLLVVVATAKVQIFKQITTNWNIDNIVGGCCCYRKGTNFQANHNWLHGVSHFVGVVVATAKVQIFKQITTKFGADSSYMGCCCYRKGTNFQANHNSEP